jgi:hypothetical protein
MFTLEQKMFVVQKCSEMEKHLKTANGPIRHLEFLRNFNKSFRTEKERIQKQAWHNSRINASNY